MIGSRIVLGIEVGRVYLPSSISLQDPCPKLTMYTLACCSCLSRSFVQMDLLFCFIFNVSGKYSVTMVLLVRANSQEARIS